MKKKILIGIAIVVLVGVVIILNVARKEEGKDVEAEVAKTDSISSSVRVEGTLRAENQVEIGSEVMGKITRIAVKEGDRVKRDDLLCTIDPSTYEARLAQAKAQLRISESRLGKAELDMKRYSQLLKEKLISKEEYERVKTDHEILKAQVESGEYVVREALENMKKTSIRSPTSGEVVSLNKEEGEVVVMGTIGTPGSIIMTVAERSKMFVRAIVDETEIVKVRIGQKAEVEVDALPDTMFPGRVVRIGGMPVRDLSGSEQAVNFPVEVALEGGNTDLYPGMSATCNIIVARKDSVLLVSYAALGRRKVEEEEKDVVFVSEGGIAKMKPVKIGVTGDKNAEIVDGISLGDTVLVGPYKILRGLKDDQKVKVKLKEDKEKDADTDEGDNEEL